MKVLSWNALLENSEISLFHCENCQNKTFTPIQTISLQIVCNTVRDQAIQYIKCTNCANVYAIIQ